MKGKPHKIILFNGHLSFKQEVSRLNLSHYLASNFGNPAISATSTESPNVEL